MDSPVGILFDLIKIGLFRLEILKYIAFKLGLWSFPVEEIYGDFVRGQLTESGVYRVMRLDQIDAFVSLHEQVKRGFETRFRGSSEIPPKLVPYLIQTLERRGRQRFYFVMDQLDRIIESDIEKGIQSRTRGKNVVRRER